MPRITLATLAAVTLSGALAFGQQVSHDFAREVDFTRFTRYAWAGHPGLDAINHRRVVSAVDAQLATRGLTRVEPGQAPDLLVSYRTDFDRSLQVSGYAPGWGYRLPRSGTARVDEIVTGVLAIELAAAATNQVVWRGVVSGDIDEGAKPEKREKKINGAMERLFRDFPPRKQ